MSYSTKRISLFCILFLIYLKVPKRYFRIGLFLLIHWLRVFSKLIRRKLLFWKNHPIQHANIGLEMVVSMFRPPNHLYGPVLIEVSRVVERLITNVITPIWTRIWFPRVCEFRETINGVNCVWYSHKTISDTSRIFENLENEYHILFFCHGGGYCAFGPESHQELIVRFCAVLSRKLNKHVIALCPIYRMAPDYPFPTAVYDVCRVWDHLQFTSNVEMKSHVTLSGDSAGGGLSLALCHAIRNNWFFENSKEVQLPHSVVLFSPFVNLHHALKKKKYSFNNDMDIINDELAWICAELYASDKSNNNQLPNDECERIRVLYEPISKHPLFSPIFGNFSNGFPPTLVQVGESETLVGDTMSLLFAARSHQNYRMKLEIYRGMIHDFQLFGAILNTAQKALESAADFVKNSHEIASESAEEKPAKFTKIDYSTFHAVSLNKRIDRMLYGKKGLRLANSSIDIINNYKTTVQNADYTETPQKHPLCKGDNSVVNSPDIPPSVLKRSISHSQRLNQRDLTQSRKHTHKHCHLYSVRREMSGLNADVY